MFELIDRRESGGIFVILGKVPDGEYFVWITAHPDDETAGCSEAFPTLSEALEDFKVSWAALLACGEV